MNVIGRRRFLTALGAGVVGLAGVAGVASVVAGCSSTDGDESSSTTEPRVDPTAASATDPAAALAGVSLEVRRDPG